MQDEKGRERETGKRKNSENEIEMDNLTLHVANCLILYLCLCQWSFGNTKKWIKHTSGQRCKDSWKQSCLKTSIYHRKTTGAEIQKRLYMAQFVSDWCQQYVGETKHEMQHHMKQVVEQKMRCKMRWTMI